jgi:ADP-ribose pyrophosphatase
MMSLTGNDRKRRPSFVLGSAAVTHSEPLESSKAKWLGLSSIDWIDETGKERKWEA